PGDSPRLADRLDGLVLPDDSLVQPLLHLDQPLALFERQLGDRNAGEPRDDFGHVADVHLAGRRAAGLLPVGHLLVVLLLPLVEALLQLLGAIVVLPAAGVVPLALA